MENQEDYFMGLTEKERLKDTIVDSIFDEQKKLFADFVIVNK